MNDESIDAENRANEITDWLNDLKMSVVLRICHAYTKKKLSSLKIFSTQMLKTMRKVIVCYECAKGQTLINSQWTLASSLRID